MEASQYCKSQYIGNSSTLVEVLTEEVGISLQTWKSSIYFVQQMDFLTSALRIIEATVRLY